MKTSIHLKQTLKQTFLLNKSMSTHLSILNMNRNELSNFLYEITQRNPFLEYTPSKDLGTFINNGIGTKRNLKEELYFQLHVCEKNYSKKICTYIIESLNDHGFFDVEIEVATKDCKCDQKTFLKNLHVIQSFEPFGVAAKNSTDSIIIQLKLKNETLSASLLEKYSDEIIRSDFSSIEKKLNISYNDILSCLEKIRSCSPFPCSEYSTESISTIIPDFEILVEYNDIKIEPKEIGEICLSHDSIGKEANEEVKKYFNEAKFYLDSINKRNQTLLLISNELVKIQKGYFLYNDELNPCTLQELANLTGFSKSTVSRTISTKYYTFNGQIHSLKNLLVSKTMSGTSKDSVLKGIVYLIGNEDHENPLTDEQLVKELESLEIFVARRTISKYRKIQNINNSKQRKQDYKKLKD